MVTHGLKMRQGGKHGKGDERTMRAYAVGTLQWHQGAGAQRTNQCAQITSVPRGTQAEAEGKDLGSDHGQLPTSQ